MRKGNSFIDFFAEHPTAANLLMLLFLGMGVLALPKMVRETFPDFTPSEISITAVYPGATAEDVEEAICQRIEDALDGVTNVEEVRSTAQDGLATVVVEMVEGGDLKEFAEDIRTEVDAIDTFPPDVEDPIIKRLNRTDMVLALAVTGPMSTPHLKLYCEDLKDRILNLPGVAEVTIGGFSDHEIRVEIPMKNIMQYGLSVFDITSVIGNQSLDLPAGTLETADADFVIRFADERKKVHEYEDLVVFSGKTGAELRLGDIATITDRFEKDEQKIWFNGQRAGELIIAKNKGKDALKVLDAVQMFLDKERAEMPSGINLEITRNITKIVRDRLDMLISNGIQGLFLVFMVMWLFFNIRLSFWVAMGLPVSFMGSFLIMQMTGMSINMLTMVGLLLALGLIMDDAIVIAENVAAHLARGKSALRAAVDGTREVARGVLSSFITTLCIFGAVALLIEGRIGKVLWVMPAVLIMTLSVSIIEAFCILPNHLNHSLSHITKAPTRFRVAFEKRFEWIRENILGRIVDTVIRWRYVFVGGVFCVFFISVGMVASGRIGVEAFPSIDGDVLQASILLPQGTPLEKTEEVTRVVLAGLQRLNDELTPSQPEGKRLVRFATVAFNTNSYADEPGAHVATVYADLLSAEERTVTIRELELAWAAAVGELPDVMALTFTQPSVGPAGNAIEFRLSGKDLKELKAAAAELRDYISEYEGTLYLLDNLRPGKPEFQATLKPGATAFGFNAQQIASQLRAAFFGREATEIQYQGESYEVNVRIASEDSDSIADLDYFHLTAQDGSLVPLGEVANIQEGRGWAKINRVNGWRTVTVKGDVDTDVGNASAIVGQVRAQFMPKLLKKHPGVSFNVEGAAKRGAKTGDSMKRALIIGIFGIFILLSFQFRSYLEPIVVISAIPLAAIGVVWGHWLMGLTISMPSIMGFASLAGVVVNDSILLVEFLKMRVREGMTTVEASRMASRQRFRAVLLTSLTTIVGLIPLLTERSLQAQILIPLCASLVFGLMASTVLVLLVVPSLYSILGDFGLTSAPRQQDKSLE
ncbi:acriflavin resistance protein [Pseudodesulfovibrio nedwellii]|uniref:Acriflavin resistance protein n=1 Tax=Pseudodesulfovibrio nedwellii TaxID=2973072 RepID=A0ABM8AWR0_9BACT|nr:efflux RND transporter permease subunit [Pseudodesulfovibrio nedwellii]BDQ35970.1 acriflavin resistance protein [Pseudodesulfovibrio nedwellii]